MKSSAAILAVPIAFRLNGATRAPAWQDSRSMESAYISTLVPNSTTLAGGIRK